MADKHPYMSGTAGLVQAVAQLRRAFPAQVAADTLKKLGIAPNNETYVLNILRFIGVLDADGKKNAKAAGVFSKHADDDFQLGFAELVETAYSDLFALHSSAAWTLPTDKLISFFRNSDHTSAIVGQRQASTFQALAVLSGKADGAAPAAAPKAKKADAPQGRGATKPTARRTESAKAMAPPPVAPPVPDQGKSASAGMALTVRVEINLPAGGDQETYDRIFKSIRENLLNGSSD